MTDISATSFFRQASAADSGGIDFEHEEIDTGGSKRPTKIHLHAVDPDSGDRMGTLTYHVPRRKADKILVEHLGTEETHQGKGVASALMDEMQRRHPATPIDHGDRTDAGKGWWNKYTDGKTVRRGRTMASRTTATVPETYARGEGEDWLDHQNRVRRGLSLGHLTYMQARDHGYSGDARQDTRDDWTGQHTEGKGWQPLPPNLYHTTTDAAGVMAHGLKSGNELGQKRGHGLGGTPEWLSMTDREDHAHSMLDALHEYHAHLNGKTTYADLHRAAQNAEGAEKPFHDAFEQGVTGGHNDHAKDSIRRGKRLEPGFASYDEAKEKGWTPHPTLHRNLGVGKNDQEFGTGWEREPTVEERHDEYGAFSRARQWSGKGKPSILFTSNDREEFAKKDPSNFAVLHVRPRPGAHGFPMKTEHEWRTGTGDAVEVHGEPIRRQAAATKLCPCCGGTGEHDTGFECYHCDGGPDDATCDGRLLDGGHSKTAALRTMQPEEYRALSFPDHPGRSLDQVAQRLQKASPEYYTQLKEHAAQHGIQTPVLLDGSQVMDGHHRLSVAHELGLPVPVGDYNNETHYNQAMDHPLAKEWYRKRTDLGVRRIAFATPVPDNREPYQHEHPWLPRDHFFAPGEKDLDPRLFDENDRMHPIVRQHILSLLNGFWAPKYGDAWQSWARVYLAGSEASHFYGNGDLDILIGVDYARAREHAPALASLSDEEISTHLTDELRHGLNDDARMLPGPDGKETGPWENTWYVNESSFDIRAIKPYAAYDITRDEWAVKPVEVPDDFGPEKLPESTWDVFEAVQKLIGAIRELPDGVREREGAALYDYLHTDRHSAFGPEGSGLYDPANAVWKALDKAPGQPLQQLIDWKHAHDGVAAATDQEKAA